MLTMGAKVGISFAFEPIVGNRLRLGDSRPPYLPFPFQKAALLMPCLRHTSSDFAPASCWRRMAMIFYIRPMPVKGIVGQLAQGTDGLGPGALAGYFPRSARDVCYDYHSSEKILSLWECERHQFMKLPRETKPALWGAVAGAVVLAIVGFTWGGWVTGGTADQMARQQADAAVVTALAPICVENFQQQPDAVANLTALKETSTYQQAGFIERGGWATMAGSERPHSGTARACADMLKGLSVQ